jgi:hypothetical protein
MGTITNGKIFICGNFAKARRYKTKDGRPKNYHERDYKAILPVSSFPKLFAERATICGATCDCAEVLEAYQPYYGWTIYHSDQCAIMQKYRQHPTRFNFVGGDPSVLAMSD